MRQLKACQKVVLLLIPDRLAMDSYEWLYSPSKTVLDFGDDLDVCLWCGKPRKAGVARDCRGLYAGDAA